MSADAGTVVSREKGEKKEENPKDKRAKELFPRAVDGDQHALNELFELYRDSLMAYFRGKLFDGSLANILAPKLCNETFEKAQEKVTTKKKDADPEKFLKSTSKKIWNSNRIRDLVEESVFGKKQALNELFELYRDSVTDLFCEKVCGDSKGEPELRQKLQELCEKTFNKARVELAEEYPNTDLNYLDAFLCHIASNLWFDTAHELNQGHKEPFDSLFLLSQRAINGFFRGKGVPKMDIDEFCNSTYLQAYDTVKKYPYIATFAAHQYFRNSAKLVWIRYIDSGRNIEVLIEDLAEQTSGNDKAQSNGFGIEDVKGSIPDPHEIFTRKEKIKLALTTLSFLATVGLPHKFLAFGYSKLLGWGSQMVVAKCSQKKFDKLSEGLVGKTYDLTDKLIDLEELAQYFQPLSNKLERDTNEIYPDKKPYKELIAEHGYEKVKRLLLDYFYGKKPEKSIADWTNRLKDKAQNDLDIQRKWQEIQGTCDAIARQLYER